MSCIDKWSVERQGVRFSRRFDPTMGADFNILVLNMASFLVEISGMSVLQTEVDLRP